MNIAVGKSVKWSMQTFREDGSDGEIIEMSGVLTGYIGPGNRNACVRCDDGTNRQVPANQIEQV